MLQLKRTAQFKKDVKLANRRGKDLNKLKDTIRLIASEATLPEDLHDHELEGNYKKHRECHIEPDWILIYRIAKKELVCTAVRTGTHSDLFKK